MSWSELERFVADVEADRALQRALKHCRSREELISRHGASATGSRGSICSAPGRRSSGNRSRRLRDAISAFHGLWATGDVRSILDGFAGSAAALRFFCCACLAHSPLTLRKGASTLG
ncbi:Nif11-like leader peptide family natural product precursor [Synechococcus sp. RS9917]|uniref:Nif11-like leader peptide family natural product precursor n=1 Tax=Synechococcus sp. RS9909 TaxID=221352 RepID=UPI001F074CE8|nr:Nif11-like leader peptide family natural product precursor [Synechococcus sp. RS9917]